MGTMSSISVTICIYILRIKDDAFKDMLEINNNDIKPPLKNNPDLRKALLDNKYQGG